MYIFIIVSSIYICYMFSHIKTCIKREVEEEDFEFLHINEE